MSYREDSAPYINKDGLFMNKNFEVDGNPLVYLGCHMLFLFKTDGVTQLDCMSFIKTLDMCCNVKGFGTLLNKKPKSYYIDQPPDQVAHDDLQGVGVGLTIAGKIEPLAFAMGRNIIKAAKGPFWLYDNVSPDSMKLRTSMVWKPGTTFILRLAAGEHPNVFDKTVFMAGLLDNAVFGFDGTDSAIRQWMMLECCRLQGIDMGDTYKWWHDRLMHDFPGGMKEVFGLYHGPDHPFSKYVW